jgi:signal transduction histidine kinase
MTLYQLIPLAGVITHVAIGTHVYAQGRRDRVAQSFLLLVFTATGWSFGEFLSWLPLSDQVVWFATKMQPLFWTLTGYTFLNLVYAVLGRPRDLALRVVFLVCVAGVLVSVLTDTVAAGFVRTRWGSYDVQGPYYLPVVVSSLVLPIMHGIVLLAAAFRSTANARRRGQLLLLMLGTLVVLLVGIVELVLPRILALGFSLELTASATVVCTVCNALAMREYGFLGGNLEDYAGMLFSNARDGMVLVGKHQEIVLANPAALEMLGIDGDGPAEVKLGDVLAEYRRDAWTYETTIAVARESRSVIVSRAITADAGSPSVELVILHDVTDAKRAQLDLERKTADLGKANEGLQRDVEERNDFLRAVAHDLGAPLRNISGMTRSVMRKYGDSLCDDAKDRLHRVLRNADAETALIGELLELSRIQSQNKLTAAIDVGVVARKVVDEFASDLESCKISVNVPDEWPTLVVDPLRMMQVFQNYIDNAIKYMAGSEPRLIELGWREDEESYILFVKDNGKGIAEEHHRRIFYMFRRGTTASGGSSGRGVGLATVRAIAQSYGGEAWVESTPGEGSTFFVSLPKQRVVAAPAAAPVAVEDGG